MVPHPEVVGTGAGTGPARVLERGQAPAPEQVAEQAVVAERDAEQFEEWVPGRGLERRLVPAGRGTGAQSPSKDDRWSECSTCSRRVVADREPTLATLSFRFSTGSYMNAKPAS
jgi:hypothetical protein